MTSPTWRQQKRTALKTAAVIVTAVAVIVGVCCAGASLLPDEPRPAVDSPTATTSPTRSAETFNPAESATTPVPADPTVPALPEPPPPGPNPNPEPNPPPAEDEPDDVYYANCAEARRAGAAPIRRGEPGYRRGLDRDNDGIACD